jgi:excisionase family DNA binding protein
MTPVPVEPQPGRLALSVPEAAWVLHCAPNTIWSLLAAGHLVSFNLGRKRLISRSSIEDFMASGGGRTSASSAS